MPMTLNKDWRSALHDCINSREFEQLLTKAEAEYNTHKICPPRHKVFAALNLCPVANVKVVILGQDPYFNPGQAVGLAFSVEHTCTKFPPTLGNIIKEVRANCGTCNVEDGDLTPWVKQGVLLLNTCLTVREGQPLSHKDLGWDCFINAVIAALNQQGGLVFVLWGSNAQKYAPLLTNPKNLVLKSAHPSPLSASRGFLGCRHFSQINDFLVKNGNPPIRW